MHCAVVGITSRQGLLGRQLVSHHLFQIPPKSPKQLETGRAPWEQATAWRSPCEFWEALSCLAGGRPQVGQNLAAVHASLKEVAAAHLK